MRITIDAYITKSGRVTLTDLHVSEGVLDVYLDVDGPGRLLGKETVLLPVPSELISKLNALF